ncbi:AAA family ATPase [Achromobacter ruhlandii]|uniref:AAA family ATPase n=1 Tax=Achromobacter ruhlandii TaxID=72557 RepID=UPI00301A1E4A
MYIERIQVEEGFLSGLDVSFTPGLNTIIGARGTGKTSLIELIRFCLDAAGTSSDTSRRSREHAMSILGSGQVTVSLMADGQRILVTRTASENGPRASAPFIKPLVFSQTEIETVGLTPSGRIGLIDSFLPVTEDDPEALPASEIRSVSSQIEKVRRELEEAAKRLTERPEIEAALAAALEAEKTLTAGSSHISEKTAVLQQISTSLSGFSSSLAGHQAIENSLATWYQQIEKAQKVEIQFTGLSANEVELAKSAIEVARGKMQEALTVVADAYHKLKAKSESINASKLQLEASARQLRTEVDTLQAGAGAVMRRGQELREKYSVMTASAERAEALQAHLTKLLQARDTALDSLEAIRTDRARRREAVAADLNQRLGPNIKVRILRNGQAPAFAATISDLLRGSGLKYGEVVGPLARQLSPRALVKAVDDFDFRLIAQIANISEERAAKLLGFLRSADLGSIATLNVDDDVQLQLLDGQDYKDFAELSTGQRCTVILPILLSHRNRMLIVDQPEDHIDNAFIAATLIRSILDSAGSGQVLFSTHNPNIPVLGSAQTVVHMGSDGKRGYALTKGPLHAPQIVSAISSVMEGGAEAFAYRAKFYGGTAS